MLQVVIVVFTDITWYTLLNNFVTGVSLLKYTTNGGTMLKMTFNYDVVIIGAGIAGLYTALNIDERLTCLILAKESIDISNSWLAQGGIAAAVGGDDTPSFHYEDTITAGAGLCDPDIVKVLCDEGPADIAKLVSLNVPFDLNDAGELQITREGGHLKHRIVHAGGDATGRETVKALSHIVAQRKNITFRGHNCLCDIITSPEGCTEGIVVRSDDFEYHLIHTSNVVIATGGIGQVYSLSTNPSVATGDGIAAAMRAGAILSNIEFIQFHPTGLWSEKSGGRVFLISEAIRGEGGLLINSDGERFMQNAHELGELAPRDIVARAIVKELERSGETHAYIDITAQPEEHLKQRFPTIYNECLDHGINIAHDKIPVRPVQHYLMGGIATDKNGCTNIAGLYAVGEAASTGVHGANRLASNSMLECLVFGRRTAEYINNTYTSPASTAGSRIESIPVRPVSKLDFKSIRTRIQQIMNDKCGVVRKKAGLTEALEKINTIKAQLESVCDDSNAYIETLNIATVACAILEAALKRPKSIGSHYMEDDNDA